MNIFATDPDPVVAAQSLDDRRVIKMATESAQLLTTEAHRRGWRTEWRPTHACHPCRVWLEDDRAFSWLLVHGLALCDTYRQAYGRTHAARRILLPFYAKVSPGQPATFVNCAQRTDLDISFKHLKDCHDAYRRYLNARWAVGSRVPTWRNRARPRWAKVPPEPDPPVVTGCKHSTCGGYAFATSSTGLTAYWPLVRETRRLRAASELGQPWWTLEDVLAEDLQLIPENLS